MVDYGQLVIGPPGSGKTTYCQGIKQLLQAVNRPHLLINLDFANEGQPAHSQPDVDVRDFLDLNQVMTERRLGPNGALIYCIQQLQESTEWLKAQIKQAKERKGQKRTYLLIDMPGQVELYTHDNSLRCILNKLGKSIHLCVVHLVDATLCTQRSQYISALLVSLVAQVGIELPYLNVMSKVDLWDKREDPDLMSLESLARVEDLSYLLPDKDSELPPNHIQNKFYRLHRAILELVDDFNLVSFLPLDIQDKESAISVLAMADQCNGYAMTYTDTPTKEKKLPVDISAGVFGHRWFSKYE